MNIFIGHATACIFWRLAREEVCQNMRPTKMFPTEKTARNASQIDTLVRKAPQPEHPLHAYVPEPAAVSNTRGIVFHQRRLLPPGAFLRLHDQVFISSPEFSFMEMATVLPFEQLVIYGMELCGTWVRNEKSESGLSHRNPVTTPTKLAHFLDSCKGMTGHKTAARALRFVAAETDSPLEAALVTLQILPHRLGGYALPAPQCNYQIDIPSSLTDITDRAYFKADLCWPEQRVCVEYDSDFAHAHSEGIANDSKRRNALMQLGYSVISITRAQLMDSQEFERAIRAIHKALGKPWRKPNENSREKQSILRESVFAWVLEDAKELDFL